MLFACNDIENTSIAYEQIEFIKRGSTPYSILVQFKNGEDLIIKYDAVEDADKDFARFRRGVLKYNALNFNV